MYLGIDLGTSGVKVVITNENSEVVAQATGPLNVSRPKPLWSEQNPEDWFSATEVAINEIKKTNAADLKAVVAIGLSGQMHGATLLDENDKILRPAILWNDGRSAEQCRTIEAEVKKSRQISGNIAMPGFTAPKLLWVKENEPEIFAKVKKVLLPKDYLRLRMTGDYASDMSDSAGTLWMNVEERRWSKKMLAGTGLDESAMPKLYEGPEVTGTLLPELAKSWGMNAVPVVAGAGDNAAGAIGAGVVEPGDAFLSLGTSGVYFLANERYAPNPGDAVHTFCHCLPNTWHQMAVMLSAASCLDWLAQMTGGPSVGELLDELEKTIGKGDILRSDVPIFLPYLTGERTPHNNPEAKGVFFGMTASTTRPHLTQAVLEGVAYAFADGQKALIDAGEPIKHVNVIGGGSRSTLWGKILANTLNRKLSYHEGGEVGPALGAARLAQLGSSGDFSAENIRKVCFKTPVKTQIEPDADLSAYLKARWQKYRELYKQTHKLM